MRGRSLGVVVLAVALLGRAAAGQNSASSEPGAAASGVSEALVGDRAARISDLRYDLRVFIPADVSAPVVARESITFGLADASQPLALDYDPNRSNALYSVETPAGRVQAQMINGHIIVPAAALTAGRNTLTLTFDAGDAPLNRNSDFLYTIFVPSRAHEAFPCFDQPDLKARWTLALDVPDGWESVANGAETSRQSVGGRTRVSFAETQPLPTYLFSFAAGKFFVEQGERNGRTFRMFHRETDAQKVARNRDAIFDLHAAALDWMERYTGIPYPFGKFDFVVIPAFQFSGMEHAGAIVYNAAALLLDPSATENQLLDRASVISHETTHMWFGDLVTMRWFDDVWMKEVFANYFAAKIVNPSFPDINHDLRFLLAYYPAAYDVDRTQGTNAIRQPLANLSEAGTLYGAIIYQKAPIVMRQLETLLGADAFRDGLREYLHRYAYGNASWPDLIQILGDRTQTDLTAWSHAWVDERARPTIATDLKIENGRIASLTLTQADPYDARGLSWNQSLQVAVGYAGRVQLIPVRLADASVVVTAANGLPAPLFVLPNGGGIGYGEFQLDARSRDWLVANLPDVDDALTRGSAWVTMWDAMLAGAVQPDRVVDLALRALPRETDELNTQRILGYLSQAYWRFVPDARRRVLAPRVERVLRDGLNRAPKQSLKSAYFSTLRDVALTPATVSWLTAVWREQTRVPGLTLAEPDYVVLSEELAIRAGSGWRTIVDQQLGRTMNPDRRDRLEFVMPALSNDPAERDHFFALLGDVANRRHEPWVLEAVHYLHHPLRADRSLRYIEPSLEWLETIQRTGDIFFPKRWMDATLGGDRSAAAAQVVRAFVDRLPPGYPDRLRRIILSSADDLFRASR